MPFGSHDDPKSAFEQSPFDGNQRRADVVDMLEGKLGRKDAGYLSKEDRKKLGTDPENLSSCEMCGHYLSPGEPTSKCEIITGVVEAEGVCDMFTPSISEGGQGLGQPPESMLNAAPQGLF